MHWNTRVVTHIAAAAFAAAVLTLLFGLPRHRGTGQAVAAVAQPPGEKQADNTACYVCHPGLKTEQISTVHLAEGHGCVNCHGPSTEHLQDEMQMTTPDVLYGRKQVDAMCGECHKDPHGKVAAEVQAFFEQWRGRTRPNGRTIYETSICTDCHGTHNIDKERELQDEESQAPWLAAFNGRDLSGWRTAGDAAWQIKLGRIVATPGARGGDLLTEAQYDDYLLAVTFRAAMPLHAGIWLRATDASRGPRVEIFSHDKPAAYTGSVGVPGTGLALVNLRDDLFDAGGWNTLSIEARGDRFTVWLNGTQVGTVCLRAAEQGHIGLHLQGGPRLKGSELAVREVQIQKLPREQSDAD